MSPTLLMAICECCCLMPPPASDLVGQERLTQGLFFERQALRASRHNPGKRGPTVVTKGYRCRNDITSSGDDII